jgi:hypothetical protein
MAVNWDFAVSCPAAGITYEVHLLGVGPGGAVALPLVGGLTAKSALVLGDYAVTADHRVQRQGGSGSELEERLWPSLGNVDCQYPRVPADAARPGNAGSNTFADHKQGTGRRGGQTAGLMAV